MSRLIISFFLALFSHLYLFQFNLDINGQNPPRLISDSSVSVTLNQNIEKQPNYSNHDSPQTEKKIKQERKSEISNPVVPQTVTSNTLFKKQSTPKPKLIKPNGYKIKKTIKQPAPPKVYATTPVTEVKRVEEFRKPPAVVTMDHNATAVSLKDAFSKQTETSSRTAASSSVIEAQPLYQYNPKPEYPDLARRRGWEGVVMLLVEVTKGGEVALVRLYESCGYKILDKSAIKAVKTWRFLSGTRDGKQTQSTVLIPVHFKLQR